MNNKGNEMELIVNAIEILVNYGYSISDNSSGVLISSNEGSFEVGESSEFKRISFKDFNSAVYKFIEITKEEK
jgi:hypothetical protein